LLSTPTLSSHKTPDDGAHAYSPVETMFENILSNFKYKDDLILSCLNFFDPFISYTKQIKLFNATLNNLLITKLRFKQIKDYGLMTNNLNFCLPLLITSKNCS
jgi:hypothetical protein